MVKQLFIPGSATTTTGRARHSSCVLAKGGPQGCHYVAAGLLQSPPGIGGRDLEFGFHQGDIGGSHVDLGQLALASQALRRLGGTASLQILERLPFAAAGEEGGAGQGGMNGLAKSQKGIQADVVASQRCGTGKKPKKQKQTKTKKKLREKRD